MGNGSVEYIHNGILASLKKEEFLSFVTAMGGIGECAKKPTLYVLTSM